MFYFTLPVGLVKSSENQEIVKKTKEITKPDWSTKAILVAEDDLVNYKYIEASLRDTQAKVIWAKNGVEAVNIFKKEPKIDIVLMDIQMPVMNGYDATIEIKKLAPNVPVIAQTAFAMDDDKVLGMKAGCAEYLKKPIKLKDLIVTLKKYL